MEPSYSNKPGIRLGKWKWLVGSVLAVVAIALSCGPCESSTKLHCTKTIMETVSSLLLIGENQNVPKNNSETGTTSPTTTRSITTTSETSLKDCENTFRKKYATSTVANTEMKISDPTTTQSCLIARSTISKSNNKKKELRPSPAQSSPIYGLMASVQSENAIMKRQLIPLAIYLKKSRASRPKMLICETTIMASLSGLSLHTRQCL